MWPSFVEHVEVPGGSMQPWATSPPGPQKLAPQVKPSVEQSTSMSRPEMHAERM
jgi:hypothetical protein